MYLKVSAFFALPVLAAQVHAFTVDKSPVDTASTLNIATLNSLESKQRAWITQQNLALCVAGDQLRIERNLPLSLNENKKVVAYEIERADDGINFNFSFDQTNDNRNLYQYLAYQIVTADECRYPAENYLPVASVFGARTQGELLSMADKLAPVESADLEFKLPPGSKSPANWYIALEMNDDGSPEAVTLSQPDNAQHTLFEVKCESLDLFLSVAVNDFLGNNSQNAMIKFDHGKFTPVRLGLTDNNRGFVFSEIASVLPQLRSAREMTLRYTNYNGVVQTLQYPLTDLDSRLKSFPALCGAE